MSHEKAATKSSWSEDSRWRETSQELEETNRNTLPGIMMRRNSLCFQQITILWRQIYAIDTILVFHLNWREYKSDKEYKKITTGQELMALSVESTHLAIQ